MLLQEGVSIVILRMVGDGSSGSISSSSMFGWISFGKSEIRNLSVTAWLFAWSWGGHFFN